MPQKVNIFGIFDADDFVEQNSLKELKAECMTRKCDRLIIGNYQYIPGSSEPMFQNTPWKDSVVWRSLFRREFLLENDLFFHYPELSFAKMLCICTKSSEHFR